MTTDVEVYINGVPEIVPEQSTIFHLIERFKEAEWHIIVERNGRCIYPEKYSTTLVSAGDRIEFIQPAFGG